jgi:hypothetical protein
MEVEMNHCNGWPFKGIPLKMKVVMKKDIKGEMHRELGKLEEMRATRLWPT